MNLFQNFIEYKNWGMNALTVSALGTVLFTILQAFGAYDQSKKIWSTKSGESVSLQLFAYNCAYFFCFFIYGMFKSSLAMIFNGLLFLIFMPVMIGLWKYKKTSLLKKICSASYLLLIPLMIILPQKDLIVTLGLLGIAVFLISQLREIIKARSFGKFSIKFVLIFMSTNMFWLVYAITVKNLPLELFNAFGIILYSSALFLYFKFEVKRA
jgi:uncharacterized protein with PQ loop repeat